jgi:hypothetical protein
MLRRHLLPDPFHSYLCLTKELPVAGTWDNRDIHGQYGFFRQRRGESRF